VRAKLVGAAFDLLEDTFDGGPIPMSDVVKSEAEAMKGCLVPWSTIDDKSSVLDLIFLCGFGEKHPGDGSASRRIESHVFLSLCLRFVVAIANYKQGANPAKRQLRCVNDHVLSSHFTYWIVGKIILPEILSYITLADKELIWLYSSPAKVSL